MNHVARALLISAGLFVAPEIGLSALAVDWGGNYVSSSTSFQDGSIAARNFGGFTSGNPDLISPASGYSGTSATFYGHVTWPAESGTATGAGGQVLNNSGTDRIELKRGFTDLSAVILWKQADFLNGLNTGGVSFDATSTASMNVNTYAAFDPGRVVIRLSGGTQDGYYISSTAPFNGTGAKSTPLTTLTWLAYDPASSLNTFGATTAIVSGGLINHVSEVGFYFSESTAAASTDTTALRLDSFEVTAVATAVPEPTAVASLSLALGAASMRRRRANDIVTHK